jgi:hypothetical protein
MKKCNKCNDFKELINFKVKKECVDGYENTCKVCDRIYQREYRKNKKNEIIEKQALYYKNNKVVIINKAKDHYNKNTDLIKKRVSDYKKNNKERVNEYNRLYMKNNKHLRSWRKLLSRTLSQFNKQKEGKTIDILGYSAIELKEHIQSLFTDSMSWDNYGEWHIDHIQPLSSFDKDTNPSVVNALSNLRPLWATTREINGVVYEGNLNKGSN